MANALHFDSIFFKGKKVSVLGIFYSNACLYCTYMKIVMVIQFSSILEPDDFGPGFSRGHANEHNLVA